MKDESGSATAFKKKNTFKFHTSSFIFHLSPDITRAVHPKVWKAISATQRGRAAPV